MTRDAGVGMIAKRAGAFGTMVWRQFIYSIRLNPTEKSN